MAISAKFEADFSQFSSEVAKADAGLKNMTATTGVTTNAFTNLHTSLSASDRVLASLGVNIGPQIRAIGEMGEVVGKTARELGAVATAGLAVSAAFAGWQLGRHIADWFDLDEAISNATASLLGWGDASAAAAGSRMDVLARATQIAGTAISDFAVAQEIIIAENARMSESFNTGADRVTRWKNELSAVRDAGLLPALRAEMLSGNSTMQEMAAHFGVSTRALEFYMRGLQQTGVEQKKFAADARDAWVKLAKAQEELSNSGEGWRKTLAGINTDTVAAVQQYLQAGASQSALATAYSLTTLQVRAISKALTELTTDLAKRDAALVDSSKNFIETLIKNGAGYVAESQKQLEQYSRIAALAKSLDAELSPGPTKSSREQLADDTAGFESMRGIWSDAEINDYLNKLFESHYRREGAAGNMPGTSYAPPALLSPSSSRAPGAVINNNITMNGILATTDPSGKAALRSAVDDALMAGARMNRKFEGA